MVQHSLALLTFKRPSALAEPGTYSHGRTCHDTLTHAAALYQDFRDSATCFSPALSSRRAPNWHSEEAYRGWAIFHPPNRRRVSTDRLSRVDSQLVSLLTKSPTLHAPFRPSNTNAPKTGFGGRGNEDSRSMYKCYESLVTIRS